MTNFDVIGFVGTAFISSYLTFCAFDKSEEGEYNFVGHLMLAGFGLLQYMLGIESEAPDPMLEEKPVEHSGENVLII